MCPAGDRIVRCVEAGKGEGSEGSLALVAATVLAIGRVAIGVHFPSDVLAGAVLGCGVALALLAPPLRSRIDRVADRVGGWIETAARRVRPRRARG